MLDLSLHDCGVLLVSLCSMVFAAQGTGYTVLRPSWVYSTDTHLGVVGLPPPLVVDLNQDGEIEVVVASRDGHLIILSPDHESSGWLRLQAKQTVSLRSHIGLATGSFPVAMAAGPIDDLVLPGRQQRQIIVALTDGWMLSAFDESLRLLWQYSIGQPSVAGSLADDKQARERVHRVLCDLPVEGQDRDRKVTRIFCLLSRI